jgi:hypothetical protein
LLGLNWFDLEIGLGYDTITTLLYDIISNPTVMDDKLQTHHKNEKTSKKP